MKVWTTIFLKVLWVCCNSAELFGLLLTYIYFAILLLAWKPQKFHSSTQLYLRLHSSLVFHFNLLAFEMHSYGMVISHHYLCD